MSTMSQGAAPIQMQPTRPGVFSLARLALCMLPLLVLALWIVALSSLATAGNTATASSPARMPVQVPASAKNSRVVMLEVGISVVRRPSSGQLGAVVRFKKPGGSASEVGRVSIAGDGQDYQFNVGPLSAGSGEVEVSVVDRAGGPAPSGAELSIGHAEVVTR
jgi:hypothetical protein